MTTTRTRLSALAGFILIVVSACSNPTGANSKGVSLSFASKIHPAPAVVGANYVSLLTQNVGSDVLVITKAQIVMAKIELATTATATCTADNSGGNSECEELHANPSLVNLPTDPTAPVSTSLVTSVPAGTYSAFEAKIKAVLTGDPGAADFLAANPKFNGVSVHVEGTWNGTPFTYDGAASAELELTFATPIVVDSTGMNITVNVDLSTWFVNGSGALVDPSTATAGGANESLVAGNIHKSFEAFEDNNKDGTDDSTQH
jgi:hypothetical protein